MKRLRELGRKQRYMEISYFKPKHKNEVKCNVVFYITHSKTILMLTAPPPNCVTGTLAPYIPSTGMPWTQLRVQHLFRRLGFGASEQVIINSLSSSPEDLVEQLFVQVLNTPNLDQPEWANWAIDDYGDFAEEAMAQALGYANKWVGSMLSHGAKERITLFWHNHFVIRFEDTFCPSWLFTYHQLLQTYALGNFRDFLYEMGKTPAMLVFLNGVQNTNVEPNENYGRELLELFTLGQDNGYTQEDVVNAARALTGWNGFTTACAPISFVPFLHDSQEKTIFGQTGNWGYDELHELLFTHRAEEMSTHICGKIYRHFVHPEDNEAIIAGLAQTLRDNDWELEPVFRQLFKSEHFFDEYVIGVQVKSPLALLNALVAELKYENIEEVQEYILLAGYQLNQGIFNPPNVAGWPGGRAWIDTNTISGRWQNTDFIIENAYNFMPEEFRALAQNLTSNEETDPALVTQAIIDFFVPKGFVNPEDYDAATSIFKWEVPQNYYDENLWSLGWDTAPAQVALLIRYISRSPEYQLS